MWTTKDTIRCWWIAKSKPIFPNDFRRSRKLRVVPENSGPSRIRRRLDSESCVSAPASRKRRLT